MARPSRMTDATFEEKYDSANSVSELCQLTGSSQQWCAKRMARLGLPRYPVQHWRDRKQVAQTRDPTQEEIRAGCLEAQKKWSRQNRELHTVQKCGPVELTEVSPSY